MVEIDTINAAPQPSSSGAERRNSLGQQIAHSRWIPPVVLLLVFAASWQTLSVRIDSSIFPSPLATASFMWDELRGVTTARDSVYYTFGVSLLRLTAGLIVSLVLGSVIGILMGVSKKTFATLNDFVVADLNMPFLVWALLWSMWLGFSFWTPLFTVVLASIPFVITNVAEGVRSVPRELVDMARSYGVPRLRTVRKVVVPSLVPFLFAASRYALSLGWKALVVAELFGSDRGAGWMLRHWYDSHKTVGLVGYAFFFALIAIFIDRVVLAALTKRAFRWQGSTGPGQKLDPKRVVVTEAV
jgi:ABC-type nitrate/sulfonate/bicarbonate transport system permease component